VVQLIVSICRVACSLAIFIASTATAQNFAPGCDPALIEEAKTKAWPNGYAARKGQYCDGSVFVGHSGGALTILGVTQGEDPVPTIAGNPIPIRLGAGVSEILPKNSSVSVIGRDREAGGTWRLDGMLTSAGLDIDPKPALEGLGMGLKRLAVRAQVDMDGDRWDVPIRIGTSTGNQVLVWLRSPKALATLSMSLLELGVTEDHADATRVASNIPPNQAFPVKLSSLPRGGRLLLTFVGDGGGKPGTNILTARMAVIVPASSP
jgi:hypothetical protein